MKKNFDDSYPVEVQTKVKRNLVWVVILSITMMFAGFTSAYIVSMGDSFWVKVDIPKEFFISTAIIVLSSLVLFLAHKARSEEHTSELKSRPHLVCRLLLEKKKI